MSSCLLDGTQEGKNTDGRYILFSLHRGTAEVVWARGWGYSVRQRSTRLSLLSWEVPERTYRAGWNLHRHSVVPSSLPLPSTLASVDEDSKGDPGLFWVRSERELQVCVCQQGLGLRGQALGEWGHLCTLRQLHIVSALSARLSFIGWALRVSIRWAGPLSPIMGEGSVSRERKHLVQAVQEAQNIRT